MRPQRFELPTCCSGGHPPRIINRLHEMLRTPTKCYRCLAQQWFSAISRPSVTLSRVLVVGTKLGTRHSRANSSTIHANRPAFHTRPRPVDQGGGGGVEPRPLRLQSAHKSFLTFREIEIMRASIARWRARRQSRNASRRRGGLKSLLGRVEWDTLIHLR